MKKNSIHQLFVAILWLILGSLICILIWGLNKGFDFTDEGFSALSTIPDQEDFFKIWSFFTIIGKVTSVLKPGLIFWRLSRLVLLLLSSFILCFGFIKWIKSSINLTSSSSLHFFYPITGIATLMTYSFGPQGFSYNHLTLIFVQMITGFILFYISNDSTSESQIKKNYGVLFIIGFFTGCLTTVKFPTAIVLVATITIILLTVDLIIRKQKIKIILINCLMIIGGYCLSMIFVTVIYCSPFEIVNAIINSQKAMPDHDMADLLKRYVADFKESFIKASIFHQPIIIISPLVMLLLLRNKYNKLFLFVTIFIFLLIAKEAITHPYYYKASIQNKENTSDLYRILVPFFLILFTLIFLDKYSRIFFTPLINKSSLLVIGALLLLFAPFICSFGTNIPFSRHITLFLGPCILVLCTSLLILSLINNYTYYILPIGIILLMIVASTQIVSAFVFFPYRLNQPLTEQKFNVPRLINNKNILFDYETSCFIDDVIKKLEENHIDVRQQPLLIFDYPGLTYLLGGLSPGFSWYAGGGYENIIKTNCALFNSSQMKNLNKTIFLFENWCPPSNEFVECVKQKGINLKDNYIIKDSINIPERLRADGKKGTGKMYLCIPNN